MKSALTAFLFGMVALVKVLEALENPESKTPQGSAAAQDFSIPSEVQYRPGFLNPWRYPLIEVYLRNTTEQTIEWKKAFLNGHELQPLTDGVVWSQFYPSEKVLPGQMVVLQICLADAIEKEAKLEVETQNGQRLLIKLESFPPAPGGFKGKSFKAMVKGEPVNVPIDYNLSSQPFPIPKAQIYGLTFSLDFQKAYITFSRNPHVVKAEDRVKPPVQIRINAKDCTANMQVAEVPSEDHPGMLVVKLPQATAQGQPIHFRLQFPDDGITQCLLRAWKGIFLDDFGIEEGVKGEKLRKELGLDVAPSFKTLPYDPACDDLKANRHGNSIQAILKTRKTWYDAGDNRPCYPYLCVPSDQNTYSIYSQCADGIQVNPYRLEWSSSEKFIEYEGQYFRWGRTVAQPRPWFWIPEVFAYGKRMLEQPEYRLLVYEALSHACKGLRLYIHGPVKGISTYEQSPPLLAEIKKINAEIKKLEPILSPALFINMQTIGDHTTGCRQATLWSGDEGVLTIVRNLDYTTDRQPNDLGKSPRFKYTPKTKVPVVIRKPLWFKEAAAQGATKLIVTDPLTGQVFPYQEDAETIKVELPKLDLGQILWIPTPTK